MKETPIIMSGNHPKLILDGIKTQTRRVIKLACELDNAYDHKWVVRDKYDSDKNWWLYKGRSRITNNLESFVLECPYGQVGDRLWVREKHAYYTDPFATDVWVAYQFGLGFKVTEHIADGTEINNLTIPANKWHWRPSIHMPRWASRITPGITEVRVERVQEITTQDIWKEGVVLTDYIRHDFQRLWDSLNAKRGYSWDTNPWVWVISFKLL